jgi:predicted nuclease of predicted toxin-antitoxin system
MKFFMDENFPKKALEICSHKGYLCSDIRGSNLEGISDVEIFALAQKNESMFLTTDRDFFHTIHMSHRPHFGIVVIALAQPNSAKILERFEWFLSEYSSNKCNDTCFLITDDVCNIFR